MFTKHIASTQKRTIYNYIEFIDISSKNYKALTIHQKIHYIESYLKVHQNNRFNFSALREITELCITAGLYKKAVRYSQKIVARAHHPNIGIKRNFQKRILAMRNQQGYANGPF
jgi:hypothetical protein